MLQSCEARAKCGSRLKLDKKPLVNVRWVERMEPPTVRAGLMTGDAAGPVEPVLGSEAFGADCRTNCCCLTEVDTLHIINRRRLQWRWSLICQYHSALAPLLVNISNKTLLAYVPMQAICDSVKPIQTHCQSECADKVTQAAPAEQPHGAFDHPQYLPIQVTPGQVAQHTCPRSWLI